MIDEAQITIRNAGSLLAQRGFHIVGSFFFAILVPRMMGPDTFGRYALVTSLFLWFIWASDLGFAQVMGRYVPYFTLQGERERLQKFFSNLLAVSLLSGLLSACLYLFLTVFWLADLDRFLLITMAGTIVVRAGTLPFFTLFLGLNQASRWGMGETLRHWLLLVLVIVGFYLDSLRGALLGGLFLAELIVFLIGVGWGKSYFSWRELRLDLHYLTPYLRFGLVFFIFNLMASVYQYSGEVLVRIFYRDYVQVGYFGLAHNVYLSISKALSQFTFAFTPFLIALRARGETRTIREWIENLINGLTIGGVFVTFSVLLLGDDLVPWVLGDAYKTVATNLLPLFLTLLLQALSNVAILLTLVYHRPKIAVFAAGIQLAALWGFGPLLVAEWGSLGGCFAVLSASVLFTAYLTWRIQNELILPLRKWALTIGMGAIFLPLVWLRSSWPVNVGLFLVTMAGYCSVLVFSRVITLEEIISLGRAFRRRGALIASPPGRVYAEDQTSYL